MSLNDLIHKKENEKYINPIWEEHPTIINHVHNWQNYVSDDMKKEWNNFTIYQRVILGMNAQHFADNEEWD